VLGFCVLGDEVLGSMKERNLLKLKSLCFVVEQAVPNILLALQS
jgi:hypothetical protein